VIMEDKLKEIVQRIEEHEERLKQLEKLAKPEVSIEEPPNEGGMQDVVVRFRSLDLAEFSFIYKLSGLQLFLAVLYVAKEKLGVDGLTPSEISSVCKVKVRVSKGTNRTTISNTLSGAGAKVDRVDNPRGTGFAYRIMREGEQLLQGIMEESSK